MSGQRKILSRSLSILLISLLCAACSSHYVTPGRSADMAVFSNKTTRDAYKAKPAVQFPAYVVAVRVQEPGYRSYTENGYGLGQYSVITNSRSESEEHIKRLQSLPGIAEVGRLNRLLLAPELGSDEQLREAAARLQADLILIYTFSTEFTDENLMRPLSLITLGLAPTNEYRVKSVASAILMDTKTGYIYGVLEDSKEDSGLATSWNVETALEDARIEVEKKALSHLLDEFEVMWARVYERHRKNAS